MYPTSLNDLEQLLHRPVAIFGAGVTGRSVARFFRRRGVETVFYDERPHLTGESTNDFMGAPTGLHRLAVVSPGFQNDHPWLQSARETGLPCMGDLDLAWLHWKGKIVAVTGTNGKSTTTKLLENAFKQAGIDAVACGNIGQPLLDYVDVGGSESWAVAEVSSFQAEVMQLFCSDAVIWTSFDEDHLTRHKGMRSYFEAKLGILMRRRGKKAPAFISPGVEAAFRSHGQLMPPQTTTVKVEPAALAGLGEGTLFSAAPQSENYTLARAFWNYFEFSPPALVKAANAMKPLPHRLERVGESGGIVYWNDSKATNFSATLAALERFDQPVYWIGGGRYKGGDLERFAQKLGPHVERAFLLGETASQLADCCRRQNIAVEICGSLQAAVDSAARRARPPSDILFSPGFSSHDAWTSYAERGNAFRALALRFIKHANATMPT